MRRLQVLVFAAGAAVLLGCGPTAVPGAAGTPTVAVRPAGAVRAAGAWGRAIEVPGLGALNTGRNAAVLSVSCPSPGNCAAGGYYQNHGIQGFVVNERNGRWGQAIKVPGLATLNNGRWAKVLSVSCASPGYCAAGGYYGNHGSDQYVVTSGRAFVVSERNGRWGQAIKVPGLAALNKGGNADVSSVSCGSAGSCAAGGFYRDGGGHQQGFVVSEVNGRWGQAIEVPGLAALNKRGLPGAGVSSVSCASAGNCAAGGDYYAAAGHQQAFVVSENNGSWGTAREVAGNLNTGGGASVDTVSCGSAGNCAAGGQYSASSGDQGFVVSEVNGTWAPAQEVAGSLNINGSASVTSVSCGSAGNCAAGGAYDYGGYFAAFVVSGQNGAWGQAIDVPGLTQVTRDAYTTSVSCSPAGNCTAGGYYDDPGYGVFVTSEKNGAWGHETTLPGGLVLEAINSVSCASAGSCVAGGSYVGTSRPYNVQGYVT